MMLILAVTLLLFYALLAMILYNRNISILESEVKQEAHYIQAAVNITGAEYLEQMGDADRNTRITWIGKDGEVFYDSEEDNESLENHSGRKEVREALANGEGEEVRMSDTLGEELYYYAVLLDDGHLRKAARRVGAGAAVYDSRFKRQRLRRELARHYADDVDIFVVRAELDFELVGRGRPDRLLQPRQL